MGGKPATLDQTANAVERFESEKGGNGKNKKKIGGRQKKKQRIGNFLIGKW